MHWLMRALRSRTLKSPGTLRTLGATTAVAAITVALAAQGSAAPGVSALPLKPAASACIPSGTDANINAALVGTGAQAVLCPGAVFLLSNSVTFTAPNQEIYTQGLPTDSTRAILRVNSSSLTTAISGDNQNGVTVENVQVDGNRPGLGALTGGALLEMGGDSTGQTVQNITAHDTRSWSDMHFIEGTVTNSVPSCQNATIQNNQIGPSGTATPDQQGNSTWADGISMACGNSMVQGNTITDATDGGIVVFGAPGSTIQNNTIIAKSQLLFGGINMVDYAPMNGNYTGTVVTHNTIDAQSAFIKIGIAMGQQVWNCTTGTNYGGTVTDNTLEGSYMGYGYAIDGVSNWTVSGNVDNAKHVGTQTAGGCFGSPAASQPAGFQVENATTSNLQSQFTSAVLDNALGTLNSPTITAGPTLSASPSSLNFGSWNVGTTGDPQAVNVTNSGSSAVSVSSITASGDFAQTNTCGSSIAAGASCTVSVTFTPTAAGSRTGTVTINSSATNSPNIVSLSGTGVAPGATLNASPSSLTFAKTIVGSTTAAQSVTITNSGTSAATVSGVAVSGDFAQTNNCSSIAAGASCTVNVTFTPTASGTRTGTLTVTSNANNSPTSVGLSGSGISSTTNLALNQPTTASGSQSSFPPSNAVDGNTSTYWESTNNAFPQWLQVDLGTSYSINKIVLTLPPSTAWGARTQTLSVLGSTDGSTFNTIVGSANYTFDPNNGNNTATINFTSSTARYVRLNFTANTGWPAGQVSEFEVFPGTGGGTTGPAISTSTSSLSFGNQTINTTSSAQTVTVSNTGNAAASISSVTVSGPFAQTNTCGTSLAAGATCNVNVTFTPTATGTATGTLSVNSNAPNSPANVGLSGTGTTATNSNLALNQPVSASGYTQTYVPANAVDGNTSTYWESTDNAFPQWFQVDLGSAKSISRIVMDLPPSTSWGTRTQTIQIQGSTDGTNYTNLVGSTGYTFNPSTGNTVTATFTSTSVRYVKLTFTANTAWPAGQLSELQVFQQ